MNRLTPTEFETLQKAFRGTLSTGPVTKVHVHNLNQKLSETTITIRSRDGRYHVELGAGPRSALSTRNQILHSLREDGPTTREGLSRRLSISKAAAQQHLWKLYQDGSVEKIAKLDPAGKIISLSAGRIFPILWGVTPE